MSLLKLSIYVLALSIFITLNSFAQSAEIKKDKPVAEDFIAQKQAEKIKINQKKLEALPKDIQEKIKSRKAVMVKAKEVIKKMPPEAKAEVQANLEKWFKSLPLEKQAAIKVRIDGEINLEIKPEESTDDKKEELSIEQIVTPK